MTVLVIDVLRSTRSNRWITPLESTVDMKTQLQFKHVRGPGETFESICMFCLLAVGVCSSEEELTTRERQQQLQG